MSRWKTVHQEEGFTTTEATLRSTEGRDDLENRRVAFIVWKNSSSCLFAWFNNLWYYIQVSITSRVSKLTRLWIKATRLFSRSSRPSVNRNVASVVVNPFLDGQSSNGIRLQKESVTTSKYIILSDCSETGYSWAVTQTKTPDSERASHEHPAHDQFPHTQ